MGAVRDENFIVEHGWMINRLGLKGNELRVYAIIYGFSQAEGTWFTGGLQYLADWVSGTKQGVINNLKALAEKGFIEKRETVNNGVKLCAYRSTDLNGIQQSLTGYSTKLNGGIQQSLTPPVQQSLPNNISTKDTQKDMEKDIEGGQAPTQPAKRSTKKAKADTEALLARYTSDPATLELLREWLKVRKAKRAPETEKALTLNLDKMDKLASESGLSVPAYLEAVIMRGWAAFYPIRETAQRPGGGFQPPQQERSRIKTESEHAAGQHASGFGWG